MFKIAIVCNTREECDKFFSNYRCPNNSIDGVHLMWVNGYVELHALRGHFFDEVHVPNRRVVLQENVWEYLEKHTNRIRHYSTIEVNSDYNNDLSIIERIQRIERELGL